MIKRKQKSYQKLLRDLRGFVPPLVPVHTRRRPLSDCLAYTTLSWDNDLPIHFNITIDSRLSWEATWMLLVHEWAHCLAWRQDHASITDHGVEFGLAFAQVWGDVIDP